MGLIDMLGIVGILKAQALEMTVKQVKVNSQCGSVALWFFVSEDVLYFSTSAHSG